MNSGEYKARGEIFNLFAEEDRKQAVELFEVLHFAKEWDLFYKTAVFARDRVNEGQFYYAFMTAVLHRNEGFVLPPPYEVFPHLFTNSDVIRQAYKAKMTQVSADFSEISAFCIFDSSGRVLDNPNGVQFHGATF